MSPAMARLALVLLASAVAGLSGCVPQVTPAEYYAAIRHSGGSIREEKSASLMTLDYYPADGGKPRKIAAEREALAQYKKEHPEEVRAARDYVGGMKDGHTLGLLGVDLQAVRQEAAGDEPPEQPTPWEEGLYVGNPGGLAQRALLLFLFENRRAIGRAIEGEARRIRDRASNAASRAAGKLIDKALDKVFDKTLPKSKDRQDPPPPPWARGEEFSRDPDSPR